jgi:hypothetical protein
LYLVINSWSCDQDQLLRLAARLNKGSPDS